MPELPEVETVVRDLRPHLIGRSILAVKKSNKKLRRPWKRRWESLLLQKTVQAVERRGKWIVLRLDGGANLVIHLGMTGQLTVVDALQPRRDHVHLTLSLSAPPFQELRFRDPRRFGSLSLFESSQELQSFFAQSELGPEPTELDAKIWRQTLSRTRRCVKAVLLDQRVVAGVGNIYADESLHHARLHPARPAFSLTPHEATRLRKSIVAVLTRAIVQRGSSIRDYVGGSGRTGNYQNEFLAYGRAGEPCLRCRAPIQQVRLAGRATHFCPRCQKLSK